MSTFVIVGSWSYRFDGFAIHRVMPDGRTEVAKRLREIPEAPHRRRELRRAGVLGDDGRPKAQRPFGALCPHVQELARLAATLEAAGHEVTMLDWNLGERPPYLERAVTFVPSVFEVDPEAGEILASWEGREVEDLGDDRFSKHEIQRRRDEQARQQHAAGQAEEASRSRDDRLRSLVTKQETEGLSQEEAAELSALVARIQLGI